MIVLIILTILGLLLGTASCFGCRKTYFKYWHSIDKYHRFLINYEETPRSKMVKKYLPPMDTLMEEHSAYEVSQSFLSMMDTVNRESAMSIEDVTPQKLVHNSLNSD